MKSVADPPSAGAYGVAARRRMNTYSNSKLIGGLYISVLARENPNIYFVSVSPGGCGTDVYATAPQPFPFLMGLRPVVKMFELLGAAHPVKAAAARYVRAASDSGFPAVPFRGDGGRALHPHLRGQRHAPGPKRVLALLFRQRVTSRGCPRGACSDAELRFPLRQSGNEISTPTICPLSFGYLFNIPCFQVLAVMW